MSKDSGAIIICDIVAFSEKEEEDQVAAVKFLDWSFDKTVRDLHATGSLIAQHKIYKNCTGDGFLAVIHIRSGDSCHAALELCERLLRGALAYPKRGKSGQPRAPLELRFGIHRGDYRTGVKAFGAKHVIGRGPNETARVARIGDSSQIIVSEAFYRSETDWSDRFSKGYEIAVKHNRLATIRICTSSTIAQLNPGTPRRVELLDQLDKKINSTLGAYLTAFEEDSAIAAVAPRDKLRTRFSVFLTDPVAGLKCTLYRHHWSRGRDERLSRTIYRIDHDRPEGIVGRAHVQRDVVLVQELPYVAERANPEHEADLAKYVSAWLSQKPSYNLTEAHIRGWSRFPQSVIGIPFGTGEEDSGVVCVDCRHPLDTLPEDSLRAIAHGLQRGLGEFLSFYLRVRRSL